MVKGKLFDRIVSFFRRKKTDTEPKIPAEKIPVFEEVSGADKQEEPLVKLVETEELRHVKSNERLVEIAKPIITREQSERVYEEFAKQIPKYTEEALMQKKKEIEFIEETLRKYQIAREEELNARERELEKRLKLSEDLKNELEEKIKFEEEVKKLLKILDELLGKLPKDVIEEFANSDAYELYERILKKLGV